MEPTEQTLKLKKKKPYDHPSRWRPPEPRQIYHAGPGRLRKIALLGGCDVTLQHAPWWDHTWELWAHMSCRNQCKREPDVMFDLHPPELWKDERKKHWDKTYFQWLKQNHVPIYMQKHYEEVPASIEYPFTTMITEFPRGYMTNTVAYMIALALMEGVTHIALYGCHYNSHTEYGPQRGCAEYWCGIAEGRGVHVQIPPLCDLLNKPSLLYGYESHPDGVRDPSYSFTLGPGQVKSKIDLGKPESREIFPEGHDNYPPLADLGVAPATSRRL